MLRHLPLVFCFCSSLRMHAPFKLDLILVQVVIIITFFSWFANICCEEHTFLNAETSSMLQNMKLCSIYLQGVCSFTHCSLLASSSFVNANLVESFVSCPDVLARSNNFSLFSCGISLYSVSDFC